MVAVEGEVVVSVKAIVMAWDEKYGGWQPADGGGLSTVVLYQRVSSDAGREPGPSWEPMAGNVPITKFRISGERLEDRKVTLDCEVTKDISYRAVMPTFHHWQLGEQKYGLKFMSINDATKFHEQFQAVVEQLLLQAPEEKGKEEGEEEVFMPVDLPLSRAESWESGVTPKMVTPSIAARRALQTEVEVHPQPDLQAMRKKKSVVSAPGVTFETAGTGLTPGRTPTWPKTPTTGAAGKVLPYPHVHFHKETSTATARMRPPESMRRPASTGGLPGASGYAQLAGYQPMRSSSSRPTGVEKRGSTTSLKLPLIYQPPLMGAQRGATRATSEMLRSERCMYCRAPYFEHDNRPGSCPSSPDVCFSCIRRGTCVWCAEFVLYHCCQHWTDGHGVTEEDMCSCSPHVPRRTARWTMLTVLALFLPCMCLYPPLSACYKSCRRRGWVGGRHRPSGSTQSSGSFGRSSSAARVPTPDI